MAGTQAEGEEAQERLMRENTMWNMRQINQQCECCSSSHPTFAMVDTGVAPARVQEMLRRLAAYEAHNRSARETRIARLEAEVARLQGRLAVLRHENNKLRRKVTAA